MRNIYSVNKVLLAMFALMTCHLVLSQWTQETDFTGLHRDDALALCSGNEAIFFSGNHGGFSESNRVYIYRLQEKSWSETTAFPGAKRQYAGGFVLDNKAYVFCGLDENSQALKDVWCFDFSTYTWNQKHDFPSSARWSFAAFAVSKRGYLVGGTDYNVRMSDVWEYNPETDEWRKRQDFPGGKRRENVAMTIRDKAFVGLGFDTFDEAGFKSDFWVYCPLKDQWTRIQDFPGGKRAYAQAEGGMNVGIVGSGINPNQEFQADMYEWNMDQWRWNKLQDINEMGSRGCSSFSAGGQVFWLTGLGPGNVRETKLYSYQTNDHGVFIQVYPNPAGNFVNFIGNPNEELEIYNWMGQKISAITLDDKGFFHSESLNSGVYFLRSKDGFSRATLKFIIN